MDINADLLQWFITFFDKKSSGANTSGGTVTHANKSVIKTEIMQNQ